MEFNNQENHQGNHQLLSWNLFLFEVRSAVFQDLNKKLEKDSFRVLSTCSVEEESESIDFEALSE